ncbi:uncharacterized protein LOC135131161 [Zophobas morio]|uniref:uncharacterized protein LOC135131161 n=1 Tax=Zophobas morio TaxID=2755281 RepID=UPI003083BBFA
MSKITERTPALSIDKSKIRIPPNIILADPDFEQSREVDLLIGAEIFWSLLIGSPTRFKPNQPFLQETIFGHIVSGKVSTVENRNQNLSCNILSLSADLQLNEQVANFWQQESVDEPNFGESCIVLQLLRSQTVKEPTVYTTQGRMRPAIKTKSELDHYTIESHFLENTHRDVQGKFMVRLPFKDQATLGHSRGLALKQFYSLERRLARNPLLKLNYQNFMREYLALNHMELVPTKELGIPKTFYLPHHPVFKQTQDGPQIRVVFNASIKSYNNLSLNDVLMTGPTIQGDLFSLLCRFRTYQYVLSGDITKMYRMILVDEQDTNYQRIFWRISNDEPVQTFMLKTLTYGTTCAPYLAVRCLQQLAAEAQNTYPLASEIINRDFYMDDLLTGSNSVEQIVLIRDQLSQILIKGGFKLCKWASNIPAESVVAESEPLTSVSWNKESEVKVLGFFWHCQNDELRYQVNIPLIESEQISKRHILSSVAKIFDPLGLVNPVIVKAKILLQGLWKLKLNWDEPVPPTFQNAWTKFVNELKDLRNYNITRKLIISYPYMAVEIHGFSDASTKAYGAAIYIRVIYQSGDVSVRLACAKSRVAPLNTVTLPRLELNAAVLLIKLFIKVNSILNLNVDRRYFWTDSTIVLAWLAESPNNWKPYVANRVAYVKKHSLIAEWHHVCSKDNPADMVSRGLLPRQLNQSTLWWHGPTWLRQTSNNWPSLSDNEYEEVALNTERKSLVTINVVNIDPEQQTKIKGALSVEELNEAQTIIFKHIQVRAFPEYFTGNPIKAKQYKLSKLDPFVDSNGFLRVGGRLKNAPISFDKRFPILLPRNHHVSKTIIRHMHERELHAGTSGTVTAVRQKFWPLGARDTTKKIIHHCTKCSRVNPKPFTQKMGNLLRQRVQLTRPFHVSGVDYAGPFLIKEGQTRNAKEVKAYIALFICFSTKPVHLELVGDLTSEGFLAALKRFTSRRGAERQLFRAQAFQNKITERLTCQNIKFHFILPRSPHFGGLWERAVRSVKQHLQRVVGDTNLNYEEFYTVLTAIEACLNSRPITPISCDPNDLNALTPGHFLIGAPITAHAEEDLTVIPSNRLSRWRRVQQLQQHFWKRKEYLSQLQCRPKGQRGPATAIDVGTLVVLMEENLPPMQWKLGRIAELHPGEDSVVRVVTVKTANGLFKRSVKKRISSHASGVRVGVRQSLSAFIGTLKSLVVNNFFARPLPTAKKIPMKYILTTLSLSNKKNKDRNINITYVAGYLVRVCLKETHNCKDCLASLTPRDSPGGMEFIEAKQYTNA